MPQGTPLTFPYACHGNPARRPVTVLGDINLNCSIQGGNSPNYVQLKGQDGRTLAQVCDPSLVEMRSSTLLESSNSPPNLFKVLQEMNASLQRIEIQCQQIYQGLRNIDQYLQINVARSSNVSITCCNLLVCDTLLPLQKTIPGYGHEAALLIADATTQSIFNNLFPAGREPAEIGSTPPNFNAKFDRYQQIDILRMVVFYNENFGIAAQDNLEDRIAKFRRFLTDF